MYMYAVLRGYIDRCGKLHSNYHFDSLSELHDIYKAEFKEYGSYYRLQS